MALSDDLPVQKRTDVWVVLVLLLVAVQILENFLPRIPIFPWLRIGFAYWILVPVAYFFNPRMALTLFLVRNGIAFMYGVLPLTSFLISTLSGAVLWLMVAPPLFYLLKKNVLGMYGTCILLAIAFNIFQLFFAVYLVVRHQGFLFQLFPILVWSLFSGSICAFVVLKMQAWWLQLFTQPDSSSSHPTQSVQIPALNLGFTIPTLIQTISKASMGTILRLVTFFAGILGFLLVNHHWVLGTLFLALCIYQYKQVKILIYTWPLLVYYAWFHLFYTEGFLIGFAGITREGLIDFINVSLRTFCLVLWGQWFASSLIGQIKKNAVAKLDFISTCFVLLPYVPKWVKNWAPQGKGIWKKHGFKAAWDDLFQSLILQSSLWTSEFVQKNSVKTL